MASFAEVESAEPAFAARVRAAFDAHTHKFLATLRRDGSQKAVVDAMQTRDELYHYLGYHDFEEKLDALFAKSK